MGYRVLRNFQSYIWIEFILKFGNSTPLEMSKIIAELSYLRDQMECEGEWLQVLFNLNFNYLY